MTATMWCSTSEAIFAFVFRLNMSNLIEAAIWNIPTYCPTPTSKCAYTHTHTPLIVITHSPCYDPWSKPVVPKLLAIGSGVFRSIVGQLPHIINVINTCTEPWMDFWFTLFTVQANSILLSEGTSLFSHLQDGGCYNSRTYQSLMDTQTMMCVQPSDNNKE